jgi:O-acetyl-ADP-ribose deacetylase (regulator of RNase III)
VLELRNGDLFRSGCEAIVNAVNCVGVMGGGLALQFKVIFPEMDKEYQKVCREGLLKPGKMHIWKGDNFYIINFPTKDEIWNNSEYEYIEAGLVALGEEIKKLGIKSVALPALGCGLGGLDWNKVFEMIQKYHDVRWNDILVAVYEPR